MCAYFMYLPMYTFISLHYFLYLSLLRAKSSVPSDQDGKESACNSGDLGSVPALGRSPEEEKSNPRQYSHLENFMDRGAWPCSSWDCKESDKTQ